MYVCAYPGVEFFSRLVCRPYLLSKRWHCRVVRTRLKSFAYINTHTHRVIVYICPPTNSMTTCRSASVLFLIYVFTLLIYLPLYTYNCSRHLLSIYLSIYLSSLIYLCQLFTPLIYLPLYIYNCSIETTHRPAHTPVDTSC